MVQPTAKKLQINFASAFMTQNTHYMVKNIFQTTNELQIQNSIAGSISNQPIDNRVEERVNLSEKQGNTANFRNSDCSFDVNKIHFFEAQHCKSCKIFH